MQYTYVVYIIVCSFWGQKTKLSNNPRQTANLMENYIYSIFFRIWYPVYESNIYSTSYWVHVQLRSSVSMFSNPKLHTTLSLSPCFPHGSGLHRSQISPTPAQKWKETCGAGGAVVHSCAVLVRIEASKAQGAAGQLSIHPATCQSTCLLILSYPILSFWSHLSMPYLPLSYLSILILSNRILAILILSIYPSFYSSIYRSIYFLYVYSILLVTRYWCILLYSILFYFTDAFCSTRYSLFQNSMCTRSFIPWAFATIGI